MKKENKKITDLVKTFEDARKITGRPDVPDFSSLPEDLRKHFIALYKIVVITEALNEGWQPNWDNHNEYKYYPWFEMSPSSFAFYDSYYGNAYADAGSRSRLKFKTRELAKYAAIQFQDIWKDVQIG